MLYHVTATHTPDNCPMYNADLRGPCGEAMSRLREAADEHQVTLHFSVSAAPAHSFFHLLEADSYASITAWLAGVPILQDFDITPVQSNLQ